MSNRKSSFWFSPQGLAAIGLIGAASYFLLIEHRQHLFQFLPVLILLLCPLMHVFMHGSHGHRRYEGHNHKELEKDAYQRGLEDASGQSERHQNKKEVKNAR